MGIRLAHISDMHCFHLSFNPLQFLSKWWVGNLNGLINRQLHYHADPNPALIELFKDQKVQTVMFSGDLTTTSLVSEFEIVRSFTRELEAAGMKVLVIPGNHDNYTKEVFREKRFYDFFPCDNMRSDGVAVQPLAEGWWYVGVDTTTVTPLFSSKGLFSHVVEENLEALLRSLPEEDSVVMMNHYPMFATPHPSHNLERAGKLRNLLRRWPKVKLYLHGHVHRLSVSDRRRNGLPIILNSGSCGSKRRASCIVIEIDEEGCTVQSFRSRGNPNKGIGGWIKRKRAHFTW